MSILQNAIDSICIGLEDYESKDERRIPSATRNIFAGILLLFKHRLCQLSPEDSDEVLIKQRVLPQIDSKGAIRWIGQGKKTVDVQNIKERFKSLGIVVNWNRLEKINAYRNNIEHYYSSQSPTSVQQLISDSFVIIRDFIAGELNQDPKSLLGEESWQIMVEISEVYEKEKSLCISALESLSYINSSICDAFTRYQCQECGSELIEPHKRSIEALHAQFNCRSCGHVEDYEQIINKVISEYYAADHYLAMTDGNDVPTVDCPSCGDGIYLVQDRVCASCGYTAAASCMRCGGNIPPEEISDSELCGYCAYMYQKLMSE
ncbi:hypothetical protein [Vibrio sp. 99-8-1]|uniref:hypothetical protein n=1 Tax=Vibrio sp. 99-8-1 TaxID=2607602 RepID=UPI0014934018|nr:hypothetical protein [Vibrio sp. 99-8-1]NOI65196.1 hypothetical protein [Vibrio sp. 99-8-1]